MSEDESDVRRLHRDFAHRLSALGAMFTDLGTEEGAGRLLRSVVADDAGDFRELIGRYDLPKFSALGLCVWVREVLDSVLITPNVGEHCALRSNLTPEERELVLALANKHLVLLIEPFDDQVVAPGPFLDDLKAHNLVECKPAPSNVRPLNLLGPYTRFCV